MPLTSLVVLASLALGAGAAPVEAAAPPDEARLRAMTARFAPVDIGADLASLPSAERLALARMVEAAKVINALFLRQVWAGNEALLLDLARDSSPLGQARRHYFLINKGPWDRLDHDRAFIEGVPPKPGGANFYSAGATRAEVEAWLETLSPAERARAHGFFTTVRRDPEGRFVAVPYSLEYQGELSRAAELLKEAAAATTQPTLRAFLTRRAEAFLSNDYYASDLAWMELDSTLEPTIGPYEVYEDGWFNAKAAFEAFIAVRDKKETVKLGKFGAELQGLEDDLPIDPAWRNPKLGALAPIRVVNVVFAAGDGNRGVQTAAYNLPNDERVVAEKGSKRVMLKNVQEAKFEKALVPISRVALGAADQANVSFDSFFTHILMHELMHGLGPHNITVAGRKTTVRQELKETYSTMEEAKADIAGLWALQQLIDKGVIERSMERTLYPTFLASAFRSVRFGVTEAHGRGMAIQLNWLLDHGAFRAAADGTFAIDPTRVREAVTALTREIMTLQAQGDYAGARDMIERLGMVRPQVQALLDRLQGVPVDIEPRFVTAEQLLRRP